MSLVPRGGMARTFYYKMIKDQQLRNMDKSEWYAVNEADMTNLSPETWRKFHRFKLDAESESFLDNCYETSDSFCLQLWFTFCSSLLSWFLSPTSVNGLLGRGSMFVFSSNQFKSLIDWTNWNNDASGHILESLLDIGAGDGSTTERMKNYFHKVYVTEMSKPMKKTLANKGFIVLEETSWSNSSLQFDVVTCLNVLDRCDSPMTLLESIRTVLKPNGLAVVSLVIPYNPYVEFGEHENHQPKESLPIRAKTFNQEVVNLINNVFIPNEWEVVRWSKLPYLCEGDMRQAFYWLTDVVFVIRDTKK